VCGASWLVVVSMESSSANNVMSADPRRHSSVQAIMDLEDECPWLRSRAGRALVPLGCVPSKDQWRQIRAA